MNTEIIYKSFLYYSDAVAWLKQQYANYPDGTIVSSSMTMGQPRIYAYIIINLDKRNLIKVT